jgi:hypothetical protein
MKKNDPDITKLIKRNWINLSADLRENISRLSSLRIGYLISVLASILWYSSKISEGVTVFIDSLLSITTFVVIVLVFGLPVYMFRRSGVLAAAAIEEYKQILPNFSERFDEIYGERGGADILAPWIMSKESYFYKVMKKLGDKIFRI